LLAEKAYRLIQQKRMVGVDKKKLHDEIGKAMGYEGFNLYDFVERY